MIRTYKFKRRLKEVERTEVIKLTALHLKLKTYYKFTEVNNLRITDIKLISVQIAGNAEGAGILLNMTPGYDYVDGKRTDAQSHIKYEVVFPDNAFEKVLVKIPGTKAIITGEQLAQQSGRAKVKLKNLTGKFYRTNSGEYALSCSADGVEVIQ